MRMIKPSGACQTSGTNVDDDHLLRYLLLRALSATFFRSPENRFYALIEPGDRQQIHRLDSAAFCEWLISGCSSNRLGPPSEGMMRRVIDCLEIRARALSPYNSTVFLRTGGDGEEADSTYFVDLGDSSGRAIRIRANGWTIVERPGVPFRRPNGLLPLPVPIRDGSIELLRPYVNVTDSHFHRAVVWLAAALLPCGPHPVLVIRGDLGSGKSTVARILKNLVDPCTLLARTGHESANDLMSTCLDTWVPTYDDVGLMPSWLARTFSEVVCRRAVANSKARPGSELIMPLATRPVILSGIEGRGEQFRRGPLFIDLHLKPILFDDRRTDREIWTSFEADKSRILGAILDVIVEGMDLVKEER